MHHETRSLARRLRRRATDAEAVLWARLRNRALFRRKFRRQHPVGGYVVDFICLDAKLIVELDGGQHGGAGDAVRTRDLEDRGFLVLRFWNHEVLRNPDAVLATIEAHCGGRMI